MTPLKIDRRKFLHVTLTSVAALSFGCSISPLVKNKKKKVALIYATRYGATKDTAEWIAQGAQRDIDLLNIEEISFETTAKKYDLLIIGSGVWIDGVHKDLLTFLETQKEHLENKIIASFILCGTTPKDQQGEARIAQYFRKFHASLEKEPPLSNYFGGRMIIDKLNQKDKKLLKHFYKNVLKREFVSWDRTEPKKALLFGKAGQKQIDISLKVKHNPT